MLRMCTALSDRDLIPSPYRTYSEGKNIKAAKLFISFLMPPLGGRNELLERIFQNNIKE